jgi:hypothetical protein
MPARSSTHWAFCHGADRSRHPRRGLLKQSRRCTEHFHHHVKVCVVKHCPIDQNDPPSCVDLRSVADHHDSAKYWGPDPTTQRPYRQ